MPRSVVSVALSFVFIVGLFISSCKKDDNSYYSYNTGIDATKDYVIGQQMMVLILNTYFKSISDSLLLNTGHNNNIDGANVYLKSGVNDTLIIRYPWWGTDDGYDHYRAGEIKVCANEGFLNPGESYYLDFTNFMYDKDTLRVDSLNIIYLGKVNGQSDLFHIHSDSIFQIFSDSSGVNTFKMQQSFLRFEDPSSDYYTLDDKFEISGLFGGISREGVAYNTDISEEQALLNQFNCSFLKQGPIPILFSDTINNGTIYFSEADTCANQYVVEFDGNPFPAPIYTKDW